VKKISKRLAGPIAVLIAILAIAGIIILWPIICAAGYLLQALAGILLFIGFVGLIACQFANKKVRIYTGLAFTVMLEGRAFAGKWPFDPDNIYNICSRLPVLLSIDKFWRFMIIPISATAIALTIEVVFFQIEKRKQEKRPTFIPRDYGKFDYEFLFLFMFSPVFCGLAMVYAVVCGFIP